MKYEQRPESLVKYYLKNLPSSFQQLTEICLTFFNIIHESVKVVIDIGLCSEYLTLS